MKEIIVNDFDLKEEAVNKTVYKARGLLLEDNKILIANYRNIYLLPGGKLDKGENEDEALIRELKEETGTNYSIEDFTKKIKLTHYQKDYQSTNGEITNRKVITYYYVGKYKDIDFDNIKMSKKEIMGNFHTYLIDIKELKELLTKEIIIDRKGYYDRELLTVLKELEK